MSTLNVESPAGTSEASPHPYEPAAYSVDAFCRAHHISRSMFYAMLRAGDGPRLMKCGARTLISVEAAQDWRLAREHAATKLPSANSAGERRRSKGRRRGRVEDRGSVGARRQ
jgi:hypothetical protein